MWKQGFFALICHVLLSYKSHAWSTTTRRLPPKHPPIATTHRLLLVGQMAPPQPEDTAPVRRTPRKRRKKPLRIRMNSTTEHSRSGTASSKEIITFRLYGISVHPDDLKLPVPSSSSKRLTLEDFQDTYCTPAVQQAVYNHLRIRPEHYHQISMRIIRRSVDARKKRRTSNNTQIRNDPSFEHVVDVTLPSSIAKTYSKRLKIQPGRCERIRKDKEEIHSAQESDNFGDKSPSSTKTVVIVGAGPAGLFCAWRLVARNNENNIKVILLDRGQPVEQRGKDIGALMHRQSLNPHSNFAFGEGGAGTWSDGKLTTRIGRNSKAVRTVLETLVSYGAPPQILVEGAPHLGTDNLVRLLRNMRHDLTERCGAQVLFGTRMEHLQFEEDNDQRNVTGVKTISSNGTNVSTDFSADATVLATGHSARDVYLELDRAGIPLEPKGFAVGFRIEHPQSFITGIQYGEEWGRSVWTGRNNTDQYNQDYFCSRGTHNETPTHVGNLPVPSYRLALDQIPTTCNNENVNRSVYSFCMCPGGQIVPASTDPTEMVVNGMSFSKRDSLWANAALVATVHVDDPLLQDYVSSNHSAALAGVFFQRDMERRAANLTSRPLVVPVQKAIDFIHGRLSVDLPLSSYRLGVESARLDLIYPPSIAQAIRQALIEWDAKWPGFATTGLLHGVETRTSSPLRVTATVDDDDDDDQSKRLHGLFPAGEGAGRAGGIVSAAVDGLAVAEEILEQWGQSPATTSRLVERRSKKMDVY